VAASISYVHISTSHLQRRLDRNLGAPTLDATGMPIFPKTRPDPTIGILSINESTAKARYDAVVTSVQARYRRLNAQATYTLAWNKDDDSNERQFSRETALDPLDVRPEWTWSKQDARHTVTLSGVADLRWGVSFGAVLLARSGLPYTAVIGFDTQNDGNDVNDRAVIDGHVSGRNAFRQPSFFDLDLRLVKAIRVGKTSRRPDRGSCSTRRPPTIRASATMRSATWACRRPRRHRGAQRRADHGATAARGSSSSGAFHVPSADRALHRERKRRHEFGALHADAARKGLSSPAAVLVVGALLLVLTGPRVVAAESFCSHRQLGTRRERAQG
jgi:hypothetical protein